MCPFIAAVRLMRNGLLSSQTLGIKCLPGSETKDQASLTPVSHKKKEKAS